MTANVKADWYYLLRTHAVCGDCGRSTVLAALALPETHQTAEDDGWQPGWVVAFLFHLTQLPPAVVRQLQRVAPAFSRAHDAAGESAYWTNHCGRCGRSWDDQTLHCEPGGAFLPGSPAAAAAIDLLRIDEPIEALADGYAPSPEFLQHLHRV